MVFFPYDKLTVYNLSSSVAKLPSIFLEVVRALKKAIKGILLDAKCKNTGGFVQGRVQPIMANWKLREISYFKTRFLYNITTRNKIVSFARVLSHS